MFTGIIEAIGTVVDIQEHPNGNKQLQIATAIAETLHPGDSVSVNGVCLTVIHHSASHFTVDIVPETLRKTTLPMLSTGARVNLERALKPTTSIGGHFVQGHIDTTATIIEISPEPPWECWIEYPPKWQSLIIPQGAIAVDGVSLTIADLRDHRFKVALIPHTFEHTIFRDYCRGSVVNLEFDLIGKYVARWLELRHLG